MWSMYYFSRVCGADAGVETLVHLDHACRYLETVRRTVVTFKFLSSFISHFAGSTLCDIRCRSLIACLASVVLCGMVSFLHGTLHS